MKKIFDLTTLLLLISVAALVYLGYHNFYLKKNGSQESEKEKILQEANRAPKVVKMDDSIKGKRGEDIFSPEDGSEPLTEADIIVKDDGIKIVKGEKEQEAEEPVVVSNEQEKGSSKEQTSPEETDLPPIEDARSPQDPEIPEEKLIPDPIEEDEEKEKDEKNILTTPGFYENTTYNYSFSFPEDWPIKIRSEENISVGTIPPKNGQGAITVEVADDLGNEIEEAKAEAQRYPGIITIKETPIIIDGISGTKMTLYNSLNDLTDVYIYLKKGGHYYVIKYSEESPSFLADIENTLTTFKFTR